MRFDDVKSETLNLRVSPTFKLALKAAADGQRRSMVNMLEALLGDYCEQNGLSLDKAAASPAPAKPIPRPSAKSGTTHSQLPVRSHG